MRRPRSILITGASSGIGAALARAYAAEDVLLALVGRDQTRLGRVAQTCRLRGAVVEVASIDVTEAERLARFMVEFDDRRPLDLVIANAGVSGGTLGGGESEAQTRAITAINVEGMLNTVLPMSARMIVRRSGQIALMSSLAAFRGFPGAPAYCASKAFVRVWGEALRPELAAHGVALSVICPGFIATPMTAVNKFRMPLLMSAERAARIIVRGLARNRARIAFPWLLYAGARLGAVLPPGLTDLVMARLPKKG